jgi:dsDNA-binding SOS-regulon protein
MINNELKTNQNISLSENKSANINNFIAENKTAFKEISAIANHQPLSTTNKQINIITETQQITSSGILDKKIQNSAISYNNQETVTAITENQIVQIPIIETNTLTLEKQTSAENSIKKLAKNEEAIAAVFDVKKIDTGFDQQNEKNIKKNFKTKTDNLFAIEFSGSLYLVDRKLNAGTEFENLVKIRNDNESEIVSFSPGIEFIYKTGDFFIQSGIRYQRLGEKINYELTHVETNINSTLLHRDTLVYVYSIINPPEGQWQYDTIWYTKEDTIYTTSHQTVNVLNTYNYFEIPLLLGKSFDFNKFSIDISTGISFGLLLKANAQILTSDMQTFIKIDDRHSPYMNDLTMNYLLRVSFRYSFNEKMSIFMRPDVKHQLGSILNNKQYPVQQKYTLYGIGFGFMYNL